jgi:hypothetical protein
MPGPLPIYSFPLFVRSISAQKKIIYAHVLGAEHNKKADFPVELSLLFWTSNAIISLLKFLTSLSVFCA